MLLYVVNSNGAGAAGAPAEGSSVELETTPNGVAVRRAPAVVPTLAFHKLNNGEGASGLQDDFRTPQQQIGQRSAQRSGKQRSGQRSVSPDSPSRVWAESLSNKKALSKDAHISRLHAEVSPR